MTICLTTADLIIIASIWLIGCCVEGFVKGFVSQWRKESKKVKAK